MRKLIFCGALVVFLGASASAFSQNKKSIPTPPTKTMSVPKKPVAPPPPPPPPTEKFSLKGHQPVLPPPPPPPPAKKNGRII